MPNHQRTSGEHGCHTPRQNQHPRSDGHDHTRRTGTNGRTYLTTRQMSKTGCHPASGAVPSGESTKSALRKTELPMSSVAGRMRCQLPGCAEDHRNDNSHSKGTQPHGTIERLRLKQTNTHQKLAEHDEYQGDARSLKGRTKRSVGRSGPVGRLCRTGRPSSIPRAESAAFPASSASRWF